MLMMPTAHSLWKLVLYTSVMATLFGCGDEVDGNSSPKQLIGGTGISGGQGGGASGASAGGGPSMGTASTSSGSTGVSGSFGGVNQGGGGAGSSGAGQCEVPPLVEKVYYGTSKPSFVTLSEDQILSIGMLELGGGLCSATLVKRDWVLTAAHCTEGEPVSSMRFYIGSDPSNPDREYRVTEKHESDEFDTTLLKLSKSPLVDDPSIVPIRINDESLKGRIGDTFEGAGYGRTEEGSTGTRYFTAETLIRFDGDSNEFADIDGEREHGLCGGDSGGPLLGKFSDGSVRVVGDLTGGDPSCVGVDSYTRTDVQVDWIKSVMGPLDAACDSIDPKGVCDGNAVKSCEGGELKTKPCGTDEVCKIDQALGRPACVPVPCAGIPKGGACDGARVRVCRLDKVVEVDCGRCGMVCGSVAGAARCVPQ